MEYRLNYMLSELQNGLVNDISWLLGESNNHDALINIGDSPNIKSFKAHTNILSARSLYFRAILSNGNLEKNNSVIEITQANIKPEIFEIILKFLYTGRISLENEKDTKKLFEYIIAAEKLWLYQLIQYIENYLIYKMNDWLKSNFVYVLTIIGSKSSSFRLLHEFVNDILKNHSHLLFDSDDFYTMPESILIDLLQNRKFSDEITEEKIWNVVLNWGIKNNNLSHKDFYDWTPWDFNILHTSLQRCIPLIRFIDIPPKTFYDIIGPYKPIITTVIYEKIMQSPKFVEYNKLLLPSSRSVSPSPTTFKSIRDSVVSIPSPILTAFPKPPSRVSSPTDETPSMPLKCHVSRSIVNLSIFKSSEKHSNSTSPKIHHQSSVTTKSKHIKSQTSSDKKFDKLLAKRKNSVTSTSSSSTSSSSSSYTIREKSRPSSSISIYSIETSENNLSSINSKLRRSSISSTIKSGFTNSEPIIELNSLKPFEQQMDPLYKNKRHLNRKTSIISHSRSSTPTSDISIATLTHVNILSN
ncbi:hypothetical protein C1645_877770 [Glomus cerebriforme]|uniref:BTB domain-containing protein n=1 Tax=Glomus cerebriforme TaxID=658196 RepID=A0A397SPB4_9GLOM|nr:hypothetical protein C1645_877770 [Glomus cerebriforme]